MIIPTSRRHSNRLQEFQDSSQNCVLVCVLEAIELDMYIPNQVVGNRFQFIIIIIIMVFTVILFIWYICAKNAEWQ